MWSKWFVTTNSPVIEMITKSPNRVNSPSQIIHSHLRERLNIWKSDYEKDVIDRMHVIRFSGKSFDNLIKLGKTNRFITLKEYQDAKIKFDMQKIGQMSLNDVSFRNCSKYHVKVINNDLVFCKECPAICCKKCGDLRGAVIEIAAHFGIGWSVMQNNIYSPYTFPEHPPENKNYGKPICVNPKQVQRLTN